MPDPRSPIVLCSYRKCARELTRAECHAWSEQGGLCDDCAAVQRVLDAGRALERRELTGAQFTEALRSLTEAQKRAYFDRRVPVHVVARTPSGNTVLIGCLRRAA